MTTNHTLDNKWTLWYHDPDDKRWTLDSYNRLAQLTTLEQFLTYYDAIDSVTSGMFFLMKEDIPPIWEDSCNVKGGIITYSISGYFFLGGDVHKSLEAPNLILCKEILIDTCAASISDEVAAKRVTSGKYNFFFIKLFRIKYF